jgi:hypothetical protein
MGVPKEEHQNKKGGFCHDMSGIAPTASAVTRQLRQLQLQRL